MGKKKKQASNTNKSTLITNATDPSSVIQQDNSQSKFGTFFPDYDDRLDPFPKYAPTVLIKKEKQSKENDKKHQGTTNNNPYTTTDIYHQFQHTNSYNPYSIPIHSHDSQENKPTQKMEELDDEMLSITAMTEYQSISFEELRFRQYMHDYQTPHHSLKAPEIPSSQSGDIWMCGYAKHGQIGKVESEDAFSGIKEDVSPEASVSVLFPRALPSFAGSKIIQQVACGKCHTVILAENGSVWSMGKGTHGLLGHGDIATHRTPKQIQELANIRVSLVSCGEYHSAVLSKDGKIFTWGKNDKGQLGHSNFKTYNKPTAVEYLQPFPGAFIASGGNNSAIITSSGLVFTWGDNSSLQLGIQTEEYNYHNSTHKKKHIVPFEVVPQKVSALTGKEIQYISIGEQHMCAISKHGELYAWGSNRCGQLGFYSDMTREYGTPQLVQDMQYQGKVAQVSCGGEHTACVTDSGKLFTWGKSASGQLGFTVYNNEEQRSPAQVEIPAKKVLQVACGSDFTLCVTEGGKAFSFGNGAYGQLGVGSRNSSVTPIVLGSLRGSVETVFAGPNYSIMLVTNPQRLLIQYSMEGNVNALKMILEKLESSSTEENPFNINSVIEENTGYSLLHWAAFMNHIQVAKFLIEHNIDLNLKDKSGLTAAHICCEFNHHELLNELIESKKVVLDTGGQAPLHLAVSKQHVECVKLLVKGAADKRAQDPQGRTALHIAVQQKSKYLISYLIRHAAPINVTDSYGRTPLDYCSLAEAFSLKVLAQKNDVFISYSHAEIQTTKKLKEQLERHNIKCWMDEWRLEAGDDWRGDIGEGIMAAKVILFAASNKSMQSEWCIKELRLGRQNNKIIYPILLEHVDIEQLQRTTHVKKKQFLDFSNPDLFPTNLDKLQKHLKNIFSMMESPKYHLHIASNTNEEEDLTGKRYVYIAYDTQDAPVAQIVRSKLLEYGMLCFMEDSHLKKTYQDCLKNQQTNSQQYIQLLQNLQHHIKNAWAMVVIISERSLESNSLEPELDTAKNVNKILFGVTTPRLSQQSVTQKSTYDSDSDEDEKQQAPPVGIPPSLESLFCAPSFNLKDEEDEETMRLFLFLLQLKDQEHAMSTKVDTLRQLIRDGEIEIRQQ